MLNVYISNSKGLIINLVIIFLLVVSCNNEKIHFSDVEMSVKSMNEMPLIFYNNKPYTGVVWSSDNQTISMEVENGNVKIFTLYHMNGKIANIQYGDGDGSNFDDKGNYISEIELDKRYPYLRESTQRILEKEILPNIKRNS